MNHTFELPVTYIKAVLPFASPFVQRNLDVVHFISDGDHITLEATDGAAAIRIRSVCDPRCAPFDFAIMAKSLQDQMKRLPSTKALSKAPLAFSYEDGEVRSVYMEDGIKNGYPLYIYDGSYPDLQRVTPKYPAPSARSVYEPIRIAARQLNLAHDAACTLGGGVGKSLSLRMWQSDEEDDPVVVDFPNLPGAIILLMQMRKASVNTDVDPLNVGMMRRA